MGPEKNKDDLLFLTSESECTGETMEGEAEVKLLTYAHIQ